MRSVSFLSQQWSGPSRHNQQSTSAKRLWFYTWGNKLIKANHFLWKIPMANLNHTSSNRQVQEQLCLIVHLGWSMMKLEIPEYLHLTELIVHGEHKQETATCNTIGVVLTSMSHSECVGKEGCIYRVCNSFWLSMKSTAFLQSVVFVLLFQVS